jgi:hypothetical protein
MQRAIHAKRQLLAATALASAFVVAACGGGSSSPSVANTSTPPAHVTSGSGATSAASSGAPSQAQLRKDDLAFAKCMRANGVPNFPDPAPGGGLEMPSGTSPAVAQAAQGKCGRLMPGPGSGPPPSAQMLAKVLRISKCIRRNGVPEWPDPRSSVPHPLPAGISVVTDYMGVILLFPSTLDLQSSVVQHAASVCGFALQNH